MNTPSHSPLLATLALGALTACAHNPDSLQPERIPGLSRDEARIAGDLAAELDRRHDQVTNGPIGRPQLGTDYQLVGLPSHVSTLAVARPNEPGTCHVSFEDVDRGGNLVGNTAVTASTNEIGVEIKNQSLIICDRAGDGEAPQCSLITILPIGKGGFDVSEPFDWPQRSEFEGKVDAVCAAFN